MLTTLKRLVCHQSIMWPKIQLEKMADYLHSILKSTCEHTLIFAKLQFKIQFHSLAQWTIMQ